MSVILIEKLNERYTYPSGKTLPIYLVECPLCHKQYKVNGSWKRLNKCKECGDKQAKEKRHKQNGVVFTEDDNTLYHLFYGIKERCYNPKHMSYHLYGGRGVTICNEWLDNTRSFIDWSLANGWKKGLTIDKDYLCEQLSISPKIYSPQTCRWITREENAKTNIRGVQGNNKLTLEQIEQIHSRYMNNESVKDLALEFNVDITTIYWNFKQNNYPTRK